MALSPLPPLAAVVSFVDCVNRADVPGLGRLMTDDHRLVVLDEPPLVGRAANMAAALCRLPASPDGPGGLGGGAGEHHGVAPGAPDHEEQRLDVLWLAEVTGGRLRRWEVVEPTPAALAAVGIPVGA